jgi:TolB protein
LLQIKTLYRCSFLNNPAGGFIYGVGSFNISSGQAKPVISAVIDGGGLTTLQFRKEANGAMTEMKFDVSLPDVFQLERKGNTYIMSVAHKGELFASQELSDMDLGDDVFVGLFICSHNPNVVEKAVFNNVRIVVPAPPTPVPYRQYLGSDLEILDVQTQNSRIIYQSPNSIQAPNWMKDGKHLLYNSDGLLYTFDLKNQYANAIEYRLDNSQ